MQMVSPLYLSYGMPKSGSTLAFELTRTMLDLAGIPQVRICEGVTHREAKINFVPKLDGKALTALLKASSGLGQPLVIKTHSGLFPRVREALSTGGLMGHAICRDPRDIALSMLDAAREGRAWGTGPAGPFRTVADTENRLQVNIEMFQAWAATPNVMPIHYERLAFDTESIAEEIAAQIGIRIDVARVIGIVTRNKFIQFNQGKSQRWKTQMDATDSRRLEHKFQDYIGTFCSDIPQTPKPLKPSKRFFSGWFRHS